MRKLFNLFIAMLMASVVVTLFSCVKEYEGDTYVSRDTVVNNFTIQVNDTTILNLYGDSIVVNNNIEGDSIDNSSRSYSDPEIDVSGGTTNVNTNVNAGDGSGSMKISERTLRVLKRSSLWAIPAEDFPNRVRCQMLTEESGEHTATFQRFKPTSSEKCIAYYDGNLPGITTLAYPFRMGNVWTMGEFGSDIDKHRTTYALRIENGIASIGHWGYGEELTVAQQFLFILEEDFLLCGLPASDGNNPNNKNDFDDATQRTGRTLLGVNEDGTTLYLFIAEEATISESFDAFAALRFCTPSRMMAVSGGSSSLGLKPVPVTAEVYNNEKMNLSVYVE